MRDKTPIKICLSEPDVGELEIKYVTDAIKNKEISSGAPPVKKFEAAFAGKFGVKNAIAVNSCGSALFLAVKALGIGPGDEVVVPTFTMFATPLAATHCGARPVFADSKRNNPNIDPGEIEKKITPRTKAIVIAHLYGEVCDMDAICKISEKHKILLIEDAAEAHGATYKGKLAGTFGVAGCFSFYASKTMTTGEGGMITTNDDGLAEKIRRLREYDIDSRRPYVHILPSWNLRMSALEAALGLAQLQRLDELAERRNRIALHYEEALKNVSGVGFFKSEPGSKRSTWLWSCLAENRDELLKFLSENGIESKIVFIPMHLLPPYKQTGDFKNAEYLSNHGISLPSAPNLAPEDQNYIIEKVKEFYSKN